MWRLGLVLLALAACQGTAADHERLGDRAYLDGRFGEALVEYRLAMVQQAPEGRLRAKAGAAALRGGGYLAAVEEYRALGQENRDRGGEAMDGLQRSAEAALRGGDRATLRAAIAALRQLAAGRALAALGGQLADALGDRPAATEALTLLALAAALAPDARRQDSLLYMYGAALRQTGRCETAVTVFEGIIRRERAVSAADSASRGATACALDLGRRSLDAGRPQEAQEWFRRAAQFGEGTDGGRAAYLGLGDVAFALGDFEAAVEAYQRARGTGVPGDSLAVAAMERINRLTNAGTVFP